eukprot:GHVS01012704.1.p1 GENE.GHVS01012704.1~~GHVS01012704.1.p1  ORF type:complete len:518 (-),score=102.50 GHVS01012704.1:158-1495(-)
MGQLWHHTDKHRVSKYLYFVRIMLRTILEHLGRLDWEPIDMFNDLLLLIGPLRFLCPPSDLTSLFSSPRSSGKRHHRRWTQLHQGFKSARIGRARCCIAVVRMMPLEYSIDQLVDEEEVPMNRKRRREKERQEKGEVQSKQARPEELLHSLPQSNWWYSRDKVAPPPHPPPTPPPTGEDTAASRFAWLLDFGEIYKNTTQKSNTTSSSFSCREESPSSSCDVDSSLCEAVDNVGVGCVGLAFQHIDCFLEELQAGLEQFPPHHFTDVVMRLLDPVVLLVVYSDNIGLVSHIWARVLRPLAQHEFFSAVVPSLLIVLRNITRLRGIWPDNLKLLKTALAEIKQQQMKSETDTTLLMGTNDTSTTSTSVVTPMASTIAQTTTTTTANPTTPTSVETSTLTPTKSTTLTTSTTLTPTKSTTTTTLTTLTPPKSTILATSTRTKSTSKT